MGSSLLTCLPDTAGLTAALGKLDALVACDVVATPTVEMATHVMACTSQLERADLPLLADIYAAAVYTQYGAAAIEPGGDRWPVWRILAQLGERLGISVLPNHIDTGTATDHDVLQVAARRADLDALRAAETGVLGPVPPHGWAQAKLPDGVWHLAPQPLVDQLAGTEHQQGLVLIPRRQQRKLNMRTFRDDERPDLLINPVDAAEAGVVDGDTVFVIGDTGTLRVVARVTDATQRGAASIPHGYADNNVNHLISARDLDLLSGMPRLSGTRISVRPVVATSAPE
jgi:anaerobic selenocysteine-containing dehydrogenase